MNINNNNDCEQAKFLKDVDAKKILKASKDKIKAEFPEAKLKKKKNEEEAYEQLELNFDEN